MLAEQDTYVVLRSGHPPELTRLPRLDRQVEFDGLNGLRVPAQALTASRARAAPVPSLREASSPLYVMRRLPPAASSLLSLTSGFFASNLKRSAPSSVLCPLPADLLPPTCLRQTSLKRSDLPTYRCAALCPMPHALCSMLLPTDNGQLTTDGPSGLAVLCLLSSAR